MFMNTQTKEIIDNLKADENIVILGPDGSNPNHLRIYSHGGFMGGVPLTKNSSWKRPDAKYSKDKYDENGQLKDFLSKEKTCCNKIEKNQYRQELYSNPEFITALMNAIKKRNYKYITNADGTVKIIKIERAIQTALISKNLSESGNSGFLICDMELCVPTEDPNKNNWPTFDIIVLDLKSGRVGLVELKCDKKSCKNSSGLQAHFADMNKCLSTSEYFEYICKNIIIRFDFLKEVGIISQELPTPKINEKTIFCGFLFIDNGKGSLGKKSDAVKVCNIQFKEDAKASFKAQKDRFLFLYADSVDTVDFNEMQSWDDFSNN